MLKLLKEVGVEVQLPIQIHSDSEAVIQIAANQVYHARTRHIEIGCHFIREKLQQGELSSEKITTNWCITKDYLGNDINTYYQS